MGAWGLPLLQPRAKLLQDGLGEDGPPTSPPPPPLLPAMAVSHLPVSLPFLHLFSCITLCLWELPLFSTSFLASAPLSLSTKILYLPLSFPCLCVSLPVSRMFLCLFQISLPQLSLFHDHPPHFPSYFFVCLSVSLHPLHSVQPPKESWRWAP